MSQQNDARPCYLAKHGFDFDMFFSYSHGDLLDESDAPLKLWSMQVHRALTQALALLLKQPPRIFLDQSSRLDEGMPREEHLLSSLLTKVEKSALFQIIMSPHYLDSPWCQRELAAFVDSLPEQENKENGRIFIAKAMETGDLKWPGPLCDHEGNKTVGWEFHPRGRPFPYGFMNDWRGHPPPEVSSVVLEMAVAIYRQLRRLDAELTERKGKAGQVEGLATGNIDKIYLYGRADEADAWQATREEIDTLGIAVMPTMPEPLDADDDAEKRNDYARLASICDAMLMIGSEGPKLDFDLAVIGRERRNFIASTYRKYLPCAVIDRRGDLKATGLLGNARKFDVDWIDAGSCDWPDYIRTWLRTSADKARERYGLGAAAP